jgi:hypothetical protein
MTTGLRNYAHNITGGWTAAHFKEKSALCFMAIKTHVVIFKEAMERYAQPEIYICNAAEADEIKALLASVGDECNGPIERLSYTEFVLEAGTISLAELRGRFAEESDAADEAGCMKPTI